MKPSNPALNRTRHASPLPMRTRRALLLPLALVAGVSDRASATGTASPASGAETASPADQPRLPPPIEPHHRLDTRPPGHAQDIALTLDACSGAFDAALIDTLVAQRIPATLFVTARWLAGNASALARLQAHPDLFEFQNHGERHLPAVVGQRLYGMPGLPDQTAVAREVRGGAEAIARATGATTTWFRGAGAAYDRASLATIAQLQHRVAGFSLNADGGARLPAAAVQRALLKARPGDIILAHMNHPEGGTAEGLVAALPELQRRGLRFVTLGRAARVVEAAPGS